MGISSETCQNGHDHPQFGAIVRLLPCARAGADYLEFLRFVPYRDAQRMPQRDDGVDGHYIGVVHRVADNPTSVIRVAGHRLSYSSRSARRRGAISQTGDEGKLAYTAIGFVSRPVSHRDDGPQPRP